MKNLIQYSCLNSMKGWGQTVHYCWYNTIAFSHDSFCSCSIRLKLTICYTNSVVQFDPNLTENVSFKVLNFLALIKRVFTFFSLLNFKSENLRGQRRPDCRQGESIRAKEPKPLPKS